jgi:hypothetical protein
MTEDEKLDQQLSAEASAPEPEKKGKNLVVPIVLGVAGIGAGISGIFLGLQAKSNEALFKNPDTYYSDAMAFGRQAQTDALVTNILFAAAGALLIAAIIAIIVG